MKPDLEVQTGKPPVGPAMSNITSVSRLRSTERKRTWTAAASAGGCCLCSTWRPPHCWNEGNGSSSSVATSLTVPGCGHASRCAITDLRCGDDLISGSPDEQDWSLVSGGREEMRFILPSSIGFHAYLLTASAACGRFHHLQLNSLQKLLHVVEIHVLSHRVLHQRPWKTAAAVQWLSESCRTRLEISVGLTPAVRHDLESQRQQVIKGRVQHHCLDLWVWHHCPRG